MRRPPRKHAHCAVCERPLPPATWACVYCGEDLPRRTAHRWQQLLLAAVPAASILVLSALYGWPRLSERLAPFGAFLLAAGTGLALLPPVTHRGAGVAPAGGWRQAVPRYLGGILLALVTALVVRFARASPLTPAMLALTAIALLALLVATERFRLSRLKFLSGILLALALHAK